MLILICNFEYLCSLGLSKYCMLYYNYYNYYNYNHSWLLCFLTDPSVYTAYVNNVPTECSKTEFWTKYIKSSYFGHDKAMYLNSNNMVIRSDDMFADAVANDASGTGGKGLGRGKSVESLKASGANGQSSRSASSSTTTVEPVKKVKVWSHEHPSQTSTPSGSINSNLAPMLMDPSIDLTASYEEYGSHAGFAIVSGDDLKVSRLHDPTVRDWSDNSGNTGSRNQHSSSASTSTAVTGRGNSIIHKYNKNSQLVTNYEVPTAANVTAAAGTPASTVMVPLKTRILIMARCYQPILLVMKIP